MSKTVKHNSVAYHCGRVGTEQTHDCLSRAEALWFFAGPYAAGDDLAVRHE